MPPANNRSARCATETPSIFNVRYYGAKWEGNTLDTAAINRDIAAGAQAGGGQVWLPPGRYVSGNVKGKALNSGQAV